MTTQATARQNAVTDAADAIAEYQNAWDDRSPVLADIFEQVIVRRKKMREEAAKEQALDEKAARY